MRKKISTTTGLIGFAVGILVLGGTVVGGVALASHHGSDTSALEVGLNAPVANGQGDDQQGDDQQGDNATPQTTPGANHQEDADDANECEGVEESPEADDDATESTAHDSTGDDSTEAEHSDDNCANPTTTETHDGSDDGPNHS